MTRTTAIALQRLDLYLERVRHNLAEGDRAQAMADCAELTEIARRLWCYLCDQEGYSCTEMQIRSAAGGEN